MTIVEHEVQKGKSSIVDHGGSSAHNTITEENYNAEIAKLEQFKLLAWSKIEEQNALFGEKVRKVENERDDLLYQALDNEEKMGNLQRRLGDAMKELQALAEISQEQDKALDYLIKWKKHAEGFLESLVTSSASSKQQGDSQQSISASVSTSAINDSSSKPTRLTREELEKFTRGTAALLGKEPVLADETSGAHASSSSGA
ncbi:unnamed protein product [Amoebophrya sp. A25]|nr:unnamed protein product [Amoebophrya sp. A25]|eukprot:GSA25T00024680001.1